MKRLIGVLCSALVLTGCVNLAPIAQTPKLAIPVTKNSYWVGHAYQSDNNTTWSLAGYISQDKPSRMSYPSLKCAGKWRLLGKQADGSVNFLEQIYRDPDYTCIKQINVSVKAISATSLEYKTYGTSGAVNSTATLTPADVPVPPSMVGSWSGMGKTLNGTKTEVQLLLSRDDRSMLHQFSNACTYDLYFGQSLGTSMMMDRDSGSSESGNSCDGEMTMGFVLKDTNTLLLRSYNGQRMISEVLLKRI